jgi:hypothetical protein
MKFEEWQQKALSELDIPIGENKMYAYSHRFMSKEDRHLFLAHGEVDENLDPRIVKQKVDEYLDDPKRGEKQHLRHLISN